MNLEKIMAEYAKLESKIDRVMITAVHSPWTAAIIVVIGLLVLWTWIA